MKKKWLALLTALVLVLVLAVTGCGGKETQTDDPLAGLTQYTHSVGVRLYMAEGYTEAMSDGIPVFEGEAGAVRFAEETFETLASLGYDGAAMSEAEYAELLIAAYGLSSAPETDSYGTVFFPYEMDVQGTPVMYYAFIEKTDEAFWTTTFMCLKAQSGDFEPDFHLWASTVEIV